jgi:hypothetical protein
VGHAAALSGRKIDKSRVKLAKNNNVKINYLTKGMKPPGESGEEKTLRALANDFSNNPPAFIDKVNKLFRISR